MMENYNVQDGVYTSIDQRGVFIRGRMKEFYPNIDDEIAVLNYGTDEEKLLHAQRRAAIKAEADEWFPKEV